MKNLVFIIIGIVFILAYLRYFEYRSLYFPTKDIEITPESAGLKYEDVYFMTRDNVKLNAWFVPSEGASFTLLFCHGNGGNINHRIEKISLLHSLGLNVFIFDYRGYGRSSGRPSEKGLYADAGAAYEYLTSQKKIPQDNIILYGESLGGAVAVDLASRKKTRALIIESTFTSTRDVAKVVYPFLPTFFISAGFDSTEKIKKIDIPKLIIHSRSDEIIPFNQSERLFKLAAQPKAHLKLVGGHNTCHVDSRDTYITGIGNFLKDNL
ncbi:MAG: alpha/beta hydrolase [Candidatus Omnitrophica bacterium]|nr:alpha/beta hydrolase [Candidatus Omnitrophota bacterium]